MLWISAQTGLPMVAPPQLAVADPVKIHQMVYGPQSKPSDSLRVVATYRNDLETIYLPPGKFSDPVYLSVLIHELTHHMQWKSAKYPDYPCPQAREREAYDVQAKWLALDGRTLEKDVGVGPILLFIMTSCLYGYEEEGG